MGLSGSLGATAERGELKTTFNLDTFDTPPHKDGKRISHEPMFTKDKTAWFEAIKADTLKQIRLGRAVLILFETIQQTLEFNAHLNYVKSALLNGSLSHEKEENIIAMAGASQMVTIATNKAGRGMDIRTTDQTDRAGGLHVILSFFPLNIRVQKQAEGRTGRMGKDGTVQMILNSSYEELDDMVMDDTKKIEFLKVVRQKREIARSEERLKVVIPMAQHIDVLVQDFCSKLPVFKQRYNKHEVKALKERWAEWVSQIDDSELGKESVEKWKAVTKEKYRILIETLQKSIAGGSIIQNPDIYVFWGYELSGRPAIDKYTKALCLDPGHATAYLYRGLEYKMTEPELAIKDFTNAIIHFTNYIKLNPTKSDYFLGRAKAFNELKDPIKAAQDFSEALKLDSGNLSAYLGRAQVLGKLNQWDAAIRDYKDLIKNSRKQDISDKWRANLFKMAAWGLQEAKQYKDALAIGLEALQMPIKEADTLWRLNALVGSLYTDSFINPTKGITYYKKALEIAPQNEDVRRIVCQQYYNLGIDYSSEHKYPLAITQYFEAVKLVGDNHVYKCKIYNNLGYCWAKTGKIEQAIRYYKFAMEADPTDAMPRNSLASLYYTEGSKSDDAGQMNNALAYYKLAEEIMTDDDGLYNLYNNFGIVYKKLNQFSSALNYYQAAIKLYPERDLVINNLGNLYCCEAIKETESNPYQALNYCRKGLSLDLTDSNIKHRLYYFAGMVYKGLGQHDNAIANFNEAISLDSSSEAPRLALAQLYLNLADAEASQGQHNTALKYYNLGLQTTEPSDVNVNSVINNNIGVLYQNLGMGDQAIPYYQRAIQLDNRESARLQLGMIYCNQGAELFNNGRKFEARALFLTAKGYNNQDPVIQKNYLLTFQ